MTGKLRRLLRRIRGPLLPLGDAGRDQRDGRLISCAICGSRTVNPVDWHESDESPLVGRAAVRGMRLGRAKRSSPTPRRSSSSATSSRGFARSRRPRRSSTANGWSGKSDVFLDRAPARPDRSRRLRARSAALTAVATRPPPLGPTPAPRCTPGPHGDRVRTRADIDGHDGFDDTHDLHAAARFTRSSPRRVVAIPPTSSTSTPPGCWRPPRRSRRRRTRPARSPPSAPTLACLETSLAALASATERLRGHALERLTDPVLATEDLRAASGRRRAAARAARRRPRAGRRSRLRERARLDRAGADRADGDLRVAGERKMRPRLHGRPVGRSRWCPGMTYDMTPDPRSARSSPARRTA